MMNPHVYLLGFLIGSSGIESSLSFSTKPTPPLYSAPCSHSQHHLHPLLVQQWPFVRHQDHGHYHRRCFPLSTPTTMHARRGGRGRRRGRTDSYDAAVAVIPGERPAKQQQQRQGAAGEATLAVQHAADEDLPRVAHDHLAVLRPGVLCQALLRIAKVRCCLGAECDDRGSFFFLAAAYSIVPRCMLRLPSSMFPFRDVQIQHTDYYY